MSTDTSEKGLETLIHSAMTGQAWPRPVEPGVVREVPRPGGTGWIAGRPEDYEREFAVDLYQLSVFLRSTQPELASELDLEQDGPRRQRFLARLQGEIAKRGVIDVLRHGIKHGALSIDLFYGTPSIDNPRATERFTQNRFSVIRQLRYSRDETRNALDLCLFIN